MDLPLLPLTSYDFETIRRENELYVDKTMYIPKLRRYGKILFLARPRRFGKSLTVSTLASLYSGEKELFTGLAIETLLNTPDFMPRPVIHLTMSIPAGADSKASLDGRIINELKRVADQHNITLQGIASDDIFLNLVRSLMKVYKQKVVLLIDEYDSPVIKVVQDPALSKIKGLLEDTRSVMSNFYSKIKDMATELFFTFITGITKFSRMGVFSVLNNLTDISLEPDFAEFTGFTQKELKKYFKPFFKQATNKSQLEEAELLAKIADFYDGFSFDGLVKVYNPFSAVHFFRSMEFDNYWMLSGSNSLIKEKIKNKSLTMEQFKNLPINKDFASYPGEIEKTPIHGFLFQAGYLSLRKVNDSYFLDYPNFEVISSISKLFTENMYLSEDVADEKLISLKNHFTTENVSAIIDIFKSLYSTLSYEDHTASKLLMTFLIMIKNPKLELTRLLKSAYLEDTIFTETDNMSKFALEDNYEAALSLMDTFIKNSGLENKIRLNFHEYFYRCCLFTFLIGAGLRVTSELHTNLGRNDLVVEHNNQRYVIELKVVEKTSEATAAAKNGLSQIIENGYAQPFKNPILISVALSDETRNIAACFYVKDGEFRQLEMQDPIKAKLNEFKKGNLTQDS
jgi:hypothetical protein